MADLIVVTILAYSNRVLPRLHMLWESQIISISFLNTSSISRYTSGDTSYLYAASPHEGYLVPRPCSRRKRHYALLLHSLGMSLNEAVGVVLPLFQICPTFLLRSCRTECSFTLTGVQKIPSIALNNTQSCVLNDMA